MQHDIRLIKQCRHLDGRKHFLAELTAVSSFLLPYLQLCFSSQHSPTSPLCSSSQPYTFHSALILQSTSHSPVRSVTPVNITLSSSLCSSSKHSTLQSALFLQSKLPSLVRSVPPLNIPLSRTLGSSSQHNPLKSALFLQVTFPSTGRFFLQ